MLNWVIIDSWENHTFSSKIGEQKRKTFFESLGLTFWVNGKRNLNSMNYCSNQRFFDYILKISWANIVL